MNMKKLILTAILALTTMSCELFSKSYWDDVNKYNDERGIECYKRPDGIYYCKDKYGNRVY
jgi:hypothetical protein